jgi:DNA modification methylase
MINVMEMNRVKPNVSPQAWNKSYTHSENTLHQLSPYIGKLKSKIASDLIKKYSNVGDLVVDPFSGAGTIPLESSLLGRDVFASDISPYSKVLNKAKLFPPKSVDSALSDLESIIKEIRSAKEPNLEKVPDWVKTFFHKDTLLEALKFSTICIKRKNYFLHACFLGILHHQRPGFLSFPSSHLVPYLRNKKYPRNEYPEMYMYRDLQPRMIAKIQRAFKRGNAEPQKSQRYFRQSSIENVSLPNSFDCLITSPPYMNTLDYGRDNRLRLWFIDPLNYNNVDATAAKKKKGFINAMSCLAGKTERHLRESGYCLIIIGELLRTNNEIKLSELTMNIFATKAKSLKLSKIIKDKIPDIRRSRRDCTGTKVEHILVFKKD